MNGVSDLLRRHEDDIVRNTVELDNFSSPKWRPPAQHSSSPSPQVPVSKHILSTIFNHLLGHSPTKYIFARNEKDDHYVYGLVLPLIGRILCSSCPGLLCIIELPAFRYAQRSDEVATFERVFDRERAERFLSSGFEVLTGNMPALSHDDQPDFSLARVAWLQAGVISPIKDHPGVSLSFSEDLATRADGVAVTFANGSMCQLTLTDAANAYDTLKLQEDVATVIFTFDYERAGRLQPEGRGAPKDASSERGGSAADHARVAALQRITRRNALVVEIGHDDTKRGAANGSWDGQGRFSSAPRGGPPASMFHRGAAGASRPDNGPHSERDEHRALATARTATPNCTLNVETHPAARAEPWRYASDVSGLHRPTHGEQHTAPPTHDGQWRTFGSPAGVPEGAPGGHSTGLPQSTRGAGEFGAATRHHQAAGAPLQTPDAVPLVTNPYSMEEALLGGPRSADTGSKLGGAADGGAVARPSLEKMNVQSLTGSSGHITAHGATSGVGESRVERSAEDVSSAPDDASALEALVQMKYVHDSPPLQVT